jgi:hypothetical protein
MKKIVLTVALIAGIVTALSAQTRFGINAGAVLANLKGEEAGEEQELDSKIGITAGIRADVPLSENFRFRPGLNFVQKGGKQEFDFLGTQIKSTLTLNYLELPLNFVYNAPAGNGKFFIGAGPVFGFGISGKNKVESGGEEQTEDINFGDAEDEVKSFEFAGNVLAGYECASGLYFQANYNPGFSNLSNAPDSELKTTYFGLRIGYFFGADKK